MVRKPSADWGRESVLVAGARTAASRGHAAAKAGTCLARGLFLCGFALLWGFGALGGLLTGSLPAFVGTGLVAFLLWRSGSRLIARAKG